MPITWTPGPGLLFSLPETAGPIAFSISATYSDETAPAAITGYEAEINPPSNTLQVDVGPTEVTVSAPSLVGTFGIQYIDHLNGGVLRRVGSWEELPAEAEEVIEFRPSYDRLREHTLTVTAMTSLGGQEQAVYTIQILQDWSAGRDRLVEEVDARRR